MGFGGGTNLTRLNPRKAKKPADPSAEGTSGRTRGDAPIVGKAKGRTGDTIGEGLQPPDTGKDASDAQAAALEAGRKARKKGAGATLLTGFRLSTQNAPANVGRPRTLMGG